jgi:hypothetical protein
MALADPNVLWDAGSQLSIQSSTGVIVSATRRLLIGPTNGRMVSWKRFIPATIAKLKLGAG